MGSSPRAPECHHSGSITSPGATLRKPLTGVVPRSLPAGGEGCETARSAHEDRELRDEDGYVQAMLGEERSLTGELDEGVRTAETRRSGKVGSEASETRNALYEDPTPTPASAVSLPLTQTLVTMVWAATE